MVQVGIGVSSRGKRTAEAATDAARDARGRLGRARPTYGLVFVGPTHDLAAAIAAAREIAGGADLVGCTTAGEITDGTLTHGGVSVVLVAGEDTQHRIAYAADIRTDHVQAATELVEPVRAARRDAHARGLSELTTIVLTDGLAGTGEELVMSMLEQSPGSTQIVGGAAGDEGAFTSTHVAVAERCGTDAAAALHVFSRTPWGVGVDHGLRATSKPMRVSRAKANVLYELDGRPAFEAYQKHAARRGVTLARESASGYLVCNELGMHFFDRISRVRAPLSVNADGSLTCAASIPEGALVSILDGEPVQLVVAATRAAREASRRLGGAKPAGVLLFDCVCRGMILGPRFPLEIDAVRSVFGEDVPVAGFLTYGEIARYRGGLDGWHNATAVVVAIPSE